VNVGPVEGVASLELNLHGVLVDLGHKRRGLLRTEALSHVHHVREPHDVALVRRVKYLDETRSGGHLLKWSGCFYLRNKRTSGAWQTAGRLAEEHEPEGEKDEGENENSLTVHL